MRRVVITGLGAVTPVGNTVPTMWNALVSGRSGVARISLFDPSPFAVQIAGEVKDFDSAIIPPKEARHMDRSVQFAVVAGHEALRDAEYSITPENAARSGIIVGTAAGGLGTILAQQKLLEERGPRCVSPFFLANMLPNSASGHLAILFGARGPNMAIASACATGAHAIGEAWETIRRGDADMMLAGGTEAAIVPLVLAGFNVMRALAHAPDPTQASRPFDAARNGFVLAEGCAVVVLEDLAAAQARDAPIYAEVIGYGSSNDAYDMAGQSETAEAGARMLRMALHKAGITPDAVDFVSAHGTGTPINDRVETLALKQVFGAHAPQLAVSSFKSMTGHMMGASGAMGVLVSALAIRDGCIPPTINYRTPDPACDLDYTPNAARARAVRVAVSNAVGLGGHNACLVVRKYEAGDGVLSVEC